MAHSLCFCYGMLLWYRWSLIAKELPGRTDNDVKNYWNTKLRKKLCKMGIDPVTHKPLSRVLSDYGNISGLSNTRSHIDSFTDSINNNSSLSNAEPSIASTTLPNTNILNMPMMDQIQHNITPFPNSHTLDSLVQSQFMNQESIKPHFFNEIASSTPSSSSQLSSSHSYSCPPSQLQMSPSSPSGWNDFLLGDPCLSIDAEKQEQDCLETLSSRHKLSSRYESGLSGDRHEGIGRNRQTVQCYEDANSSSANSFVESILVEYSKMQMEFPQLLDEYLNY